MNAGHPSRLMVGSNNGQMIEKYLHICRLVNSVLVKDKWSFRVASVTVGSVKPGVQWIRIIEYFLLAEETAHFHFGSFYAIRGMDDVFLAATGKKPEEN